MDRHRVVPDSNPTFHFDGDPDQDPTPSLRMLENQNFFLLLFIAMPVYGGLSL